VNALLRHGKEGAPDPLKALAHELRPKLLALTSLGPLGVRELAERCECARSTAETHLGALRDLGAVDRVPMSSERGRVVHGYVPSRDWRPVAVVFLKLIEAERGKYPLEELRCLLEEMGELLEETRELLEELEAERKGGPR
jgi:predicted transcriptional regulator